MKSFLKGLSYTILVLGTIGSFCLANVFGKELTYSSYLGKSYTIRDTGLTIGIFAGSLISTLILFAILLGLASILENQETLSTKLVNEIESLKSHIRNIEKANDSD